MLFAGSFLREDLCEVDVYQRKDLMDLECVF